MRRPGRPQEIDDDTLRRVLGELNFVLEQNWGLIGWELSQTKTMAGIRSAFERIVGFNCHQLDAFRHEPTQRTTSATLRRLRDDFANSQVQSRKAYGALEQAKRNAKYAQAAATCTEGAAARMEIQTLLLEMTARHESARADFEANRKRLVALDSQLMEQEAYFAQSQLLEFIQSGRREFTPLNLAMAMAGIPYLSARVSCERCSALKPNVEPGHTYLMFRAVEAVFASSPGEARPDSEQMRAYLLDPRRERLPHIAELRRNWHFLESAIHSVCRDTGTARGALPYRIFAEYRRRFSCQSQSDVLLAEENQLRRPIR